MKSIAIPVLIWVAVIAVSARLSFDIPATDINITGQTLAILTMAVLAKPRIAIASILLYIIVGTLGLPVFSDGNSGWYSFTGSSLGYFIGFVVAVVVIGQIYYHSGWSRYQRNWIYILLLQIIGTVIILTLGVSRLSLIMPLAEAIQNGALPFIAGGLIKSVIATVIIMACYNLNRSAL